jgi:hypothetical protein
MAADGVVLNRVQEKINKNLKKLKTPFSNNYLSKAQDQSTFWFGYESG